MCGLLFRAVFVWFSLLFFKTGIDTVLIQRMTRITYNQIKTINTLNNNISISRFVANPPAPGSGQMSSFSGKSNAHVFEVQAKPRKSGTGRPNGSPRTAQGGSSGTCCSVVVPWSSLSHVLACPRRCSALLRSSWPLIGLKSC